MAEGTEKQAPREKIQGYICGAERPNREGTEIHIPASATSTHFSILMDSVSCYPETSERYLQHGPLFGAALLRYMCLWFRSFYYLFHKVTYKIRIFGASNNKTC